MDVENKGFHSQEGILLCQSNRSVSLFERSPRRSLVRNQDDDKAWRSGRSPPGTGAGVQRGRTAHQEQRLCCLWFLTDKGHGTRATSSNRGHTGSAPSTPWACSGGRSSVTHRSDVRAAGRHRADSTWGPAARDPSQASEVNRPESKGHCASGVPWALGKPHLPHSSSRKRPWWRLPLSTSGDKVKTRHRRRRHTEDCLWPGVPSVTLRLSLTTRPLGAKGKGAPLPAPYQFCGQGCPPSGMEKFDEITHLFIYVYNLCF